ncbi:NUDIX hydrolase [Cytobacillus sp. IB215665]|uniref:NUDIX hydrolase n=1 Tax=Cytobacillus sp. IB215665 TaxID=3097357 RepID=UPI002A143E04|nr:NUDIX domain-containing protein [Cytobacillus sp. IB215665]MDX8365658.1 NUDIX domain-containing protein [Cytobacillus sp. IB215665]
MNFNKILELHNNRTYNGIIYREAIRAIIISKNHILLVHSNRGDYKFPGGGVEENESHYETLVREVREETGYTNCVVKEKVGTVIERNMDEYIKDKLFQMTSHYYLCELTNKEYISQQLDEYESVLEFKPRWVSIEEALKKNESLMNQFEKNSWLKRETFVLNELKQLYKR